MRVLVVLALLAIVGVGGLVLVSRPSSAASERLAGVSVGVMGVRLLPAGDGGKQLALDIVITARRAVDECLAFALDEPFTGRVMRPTGPGDGCLRPGPTPVRATIAMQHMTDSDTVFAAHTLLWGARGGICGLMTLLGMCAVDTAGTVDLTLPVRSGLPTFGRFTFAPLPTFSFSRH